MGMDYSVYVGPYLMCQHGDIDEEKWESVVCDGRCEARKDGEKLILVPNCDLPGVSREMEFERTGCDEITELGLATVDREMDAFREVVTPLVNDLIEANAWFRVCWGVVPCWS